MRCQWLSHNLTNETPCYGGRKNIDIQPDSQISTGHSCNSLTISMSNHTGSHVDAPNHFISGGASITEYSAEDWVFTKPHLIDLSVPLGTLVTSSSIEKELQSIPHGTDLVFFRFGMEKHRNTENYWSSNPGLSDDLVARLKKHPDLSAIALDTISLTSFEHREAGRIAHRAFLGSNFRVFEDLSLQSLDIDSMPSMAVACPLPIQGADGAPCSVLGIWN